MFRLLLAALTVVWSAAVPPPPVAAPAADQAFVVSLPVAKAAVAVLGQHTWAVSFCEPCGDAAHTVVPVGNVRAVPWEPDPRFWVVEVNGSGVDLAYTYVPLEGAGLVANLAMLANAGPVVDVSPVLTIEMGE